MASFLESLLSVPTVSGGEKALTDKIDRYIKKYTDETHTDALGNLIATRHALSKKGKKPLKLAFFCAVDAPGRIVTYVEENGLVRTSPIGKTSAERAVYTEVAKTDKKYTGILIPDNGKTEATEPLYADFGFANAKEAAKHLSLGDLLCFVQEPVFLGKTQLCAPALGNKLCAAALAGLAAKTETAAALEISFVFCAQSVLGARGAAPAAFGIQPDIAVCLETYEGTELGLRLSDRFSVGDHDLVRQMKNAASQVGAVLTPRIETEAVTTDTARINGAGDGTRTVTLLYPVHALGLPRERADTALCDTLVRVLEQFLQNL